jgi:argininosuccinate synthase
VAPILARKEIGDDILLLMIDLGCGAAEIDQAKRRADVLGMDFVLLDGKREFAEEFLAEAVRMNGSYWGYPLGTPLGRAFMVRAALRYLSENQNIRRYVVHGCNKSQNTRYRIEKLCRSDDNVYPVGPLVTQALSREDKKAILAANGIAVTAGDAYAQDDNMFCRAIEGDVLNDLSSVDTLDVFRVTRSLLDAPDTPAEVEITFRAGTPVALDGEPGPLDEIVMRLRNLGAEHAVGRVVCMEDTIPELGYKERGVYESPAAAILYTAHRYLESAVLNRTERMTKQMLEHRWADAVYRGDWYSAERREISELCERFHEAVEGRVRCRLYKGNVTLLDADAPKSRLLAAADSVGAY